MTNWLFTHEPYEGEPTSSQMQKSLEAAGLTVEFVMLRTWIITVASEELGIGGEAVDYLASRIAPLVNAKNTPFAIGEIGRFGAHRSPGDHGAIARILVPGLPSDLPM